MSSKKALSMENLQEAMSLNNEKILEYINKELDSLRNENTELKKQVETLSETLTAITGGDIVTYTIDTE